MFTELELTVEEIQVLLNIFQQNEITGLPVRKTDMNVDDVGRAWEKKGYMEKHNGALRLEKCLELMALTMMDPQVCLVMETEEQERDICNVYMHGETIILVRNIEDRYLISWIPFLPPLLGGVYGFYEDRIENNVDDISVQYSMHNTISGDVSGRINKIGDNILLIETDPELKDTDMTVDECFKYIQHFLVYGHRDCLMQAAQAR